MSATKKTASKKLSDIVQSPTGERLDGQNSEVPASGEDSSIPSAQASREQLVREAAYRLFEARGSTHGDHEKDWLDAERAVSEAKRG